MKLENEPIWIRRMAIAFSEWTKRYVENPEAFSNIGDSSDEDGYTSAKYFDSLLRELDAEGRLPKK